MLPVRTDMECMRKPFMWHRAGGSLHIVRSGDQGGISEVDGDGGWDDQEERPQPAAQVGTGVLRERVKVVSA